MQRAGPERSLGQCCVRALHLTVTSLWARWLRSLCACGHGLQADLDEMLQRTASVCKCQAGPAGAVSDYLAYGTSMDYMYTQLGVPYAITLELYGQGQVGMLQGGE